MSEIKTDVSDQYGARPFEQQQFGTAGVEGVKYTFQNPQTRLAIRSYTYAGGLVCFRLKGKSCFSNILSGLMSTCDRLSGVR